jgi:hypothetical protein
MYDNYFMLINSDENEAGFVYFTDDGFINRIWIWGTSVEIRDDQTLITDTNFKNCLDNHSVAYKSELPTLIPTSVIDALF